MEVVHSGGKEKAPLVALVLALIVLGLGSLFLTWRSIGQQRQIVEDHLTMTGGSILRGVDNNLNRILRSLRMNPQAAPLFPSLSAELFQELAKSDDIVFIALYDQSGLPIVTSSEKGHPTLDLPENLLTEIDPGRAWHYMASMERKSVLISGIVVRPNIALLSTGRPLPERGMGKGMGQGMMHGKPPHTRQGMDEKDIDAPTIMLVVGLNAEKNMAQFRQYRRAALYQTGYVFIAAVVLWTMVFGYLRRRDQSRKLVRLERFQSKLLDNMPDGLVTLDESGEIMAANHSAKKLLAPMGEEGVPEIIGSNWRDLPFGQKAGEQFFTTLYEWEQFDYQGRQLEILSLPFRERDEDAAPELGQRLVLIRDRTHIRSLEEDLNEAKRLAAIGSLAAGVAHEVRNPLSSLRGFAQLFANKLKGQKPLDEYATTMVQEADRLNRVVTDLLYLAKPRKLAVEENDLSQVSESLKKLMRFDFERRQTEPEFDFATDAVHADPDALRQVLLNLISNSLDAIESCEQCEKPGHITLTSLRDDSGVWLTVSDDGPGMDPNIRDEVFKPFVTGKKTGTGLGLAIVHNIMRAHKGKVVIDSEPGKGTRMQLYFPDTMGTENIDEEIS